MENDATKQLVMDGFARISYLINLMQGTIEGSKTHRMMLMKLEKSFDELAVFGISRADIFVILGQTGDILLLPNSLEWRTPKAVPMRLP